MGAGNFAKASAFNRSINWEYYENNISNSALVADFKAKFEATEIPVPSDEGLAAKLEARAVEDEAAVAAYLTKVDGQIDVASATMNNLKALPPFEQMTSQDILFWFPQLCRNQEWVAGSENTPAYSRRTSTNSKSAWVPTTAATNGVSKRNNSQRANSPTFSPDSRRKTSRNRLRWPIR